MSRSKKSVRADLSQSKYMVTGMNNFRLLREVKIIAALIQIVGVVSCWAQLPNELRNVTGIAVYSQGDLGSDLAVAATYQAIEQFQQTFTVRTPTTTVRVLRKGLYENIPVQAFSGVVQSAEDRARLEQDLKKVEAAAENYRAASGVLTRIALELSKLKERYDLGERYIDHEWMAKGPEMPAATSMPKGGAESLSVPPVTLIGAGGREFLNPEFLRVEGDIVHFRHSGGFSSISVGSLPQSFKQLWAGGLNASVEASEMTKVEFQGKALEPTSFNWVPSSIDEATECVVLIEGDAGSGTGFLCFDSGFFYIYTNAHVLAGNRQLKITTPLGQGFSKFRFIETAPHGYDNGDLVRLALAELPEKALRLAPAEKVPKADDAIWALGNSQGSGVIRALEGKLVSIGPTRLEITAEIVKGNSGGPILDSEFNVVGVSSFGEYRVDVWSKGTELDAVRRFALRPGAVPSWDRLNSVDFLRIAYIYDQMLADVVLTAVISEMSFSVNGITYNPKEEVMAGMNANELVNAFKNHDFAAGLLRFNKELENSSQGKAGGEQMRNTLLSYANLFSAGHTGMIARQRYVKTQNNIPYFLGRKFNEILSDHHSATETILTRATEINRALGGR